MQSSKRNTGPPRQRASYGLMQHHERISEESEPDVNSASVDASQRYSDNSDAQASDDVVSIRLQQKKQTGRRQGLVNSSQIEQVRAFRHRKITQHLQHLITTRRDSFEKSAPMTVYKPI